MHERSRVVFCDGSGNIDVVFLSFSVAGQIWGKRPVNPLFRTLTLICGEGYGLDNFAPVPSPG